MIDSASSAGQGVKRLAFLNVARRVRIDLPEPRRWAGLHGRHHVVRRVAIDEEPHPAGLHRFELTGALPGAPAHRAQLHTALNDRRGVMAAAVLRDAAGRFRLCG